MADSLRATLANRIFRLFAFLGLCALAVLLVGLHWAAVVPGPDESLSADRSGLIAPALAANDPPVADAGLDQSAAVNDTVTLDGSGSTEPEGTKISFAWTIVSVRRRFTAP